MPNILWLIGKIMEDFLFSDVTTSVRSFLLAEFSVWSWNNICSNLQKSTLKHFRHLSFLMTTANAKFCRTKIKCYTQKVMGFTYTAKAEKHTPNLPFWFYESGCEEGFHSVSLCQCHYFTEACQNASRAKLSVSGLFKGLILDELSCHLFTRHDGLSLIKMYWSLNLFSYKKPNK